MFNWLRTLLFGPSHEQRMPERLVKDWEAEYQEKMRLRGPFPATVSVAPVSTVAVTSTTPYTTPGIEYTEEERLARIRRMKEDADRRRMDERRDNSGPDLLTTGLVAAAVIGASSYVDSTPSYSPSSDSGSCSSHASGSSSSDSSSASSGNSGGGSCGGGE